MEQLFPDFTGKSIYTLACGIAKYLGVKRDCLGSIELSASRLALVLLDGFGCNIAVSLGIKNLECMTTVFPSSTATVIATLFTASTPGEHGVLGFSNFSKLLGTMVNPLRFSTPFNSSRDSLKDYFSFSKVYPNVRSYLQEVNKDKRTAEIVPKGIEQTEFTLATHGRTTVTKTFVNLWDAYLEASNVLSEGYDFVYIYIPDVDTVAHKTGSESLATARTARDVWGMISELADKFKNYTFVVTADHGLITVEKDYLLNTDQELFKYLDLPPYGDSRALMLKSRHRISEYLRNKYPSLSTFEGSQIVRLLGRIDNTLDLPDVIAVPTDRSAFLYAFREKQMEELGKLKGHHGGLSQEEMRVPLVILNG